MTTQETNKTLNPKLLREAVGPGYQVSGVTDRIFVYLHGR